MAECPGNGQGTGELSDTNDNPGTILDVYGSPAASLGTHVRDAPKAGKAYGGSCPDTANNPNGCYTLTYTVTRVNDAATRVLVGGSGNPNTSAPAPPPCWPGPPWPSAGWSLPGLGSGACG